MRSPSDKKRSARRAGKRERARAKICHRTWSVAGRMTTVGGAGISYEIYAHGAKSRKIQRWIDRLAHLGGDSILKSGAVIGRPLYKITVR